MLLPREARPGRDSWALGRVSSAAALAAQEAAPALEPGAVRAEHLLGGGGEQVGLLGKQHFH